MQPSARATELRAAIEAASGTTATVVEISPTRIRIAVPIAPTLPDADYHSTLAAARAGDDWGSSGEGGTVMVWAEVVEPRKTP
jgi:hypothetical protein